MDAVSYTHLDVYKRQHIHHGYPAFCVAVYFFHIIFRQHTAGHIEIPLKDVYKRQHKDHITPRKFKARQLIRRQIGHDQHADDGHAHIDKRLDS